MKTNKSQRAIYQAAKGLFWKHGIKKVSVEEICSSAEVSKMTFYRNFKNKDELALELIKEITLKGQADYKAIMASEKTFPEKVKDMILQKHESANNISAEFINDIYVNPESPAKQFLDRYREEFTKTMFKDFSEAQKQGWIRQDLKMEFIFYMLGSIQEKISDPNLTALFPDMHKAIMELTNFFFYGILSDKK